MLNKTKYTKQNQIALNIALNSSWLTKLDGWQA